MSRRLRPILIAAVLIVGTWMVMPADAQGRFWVLVNGALRYTGAVTISGPLTTQAGTGTQSGGTPVGIFTSTAAVANGTTVETDLISYSMPANTLSTNGQKVRITSWGALANTANTKTVKIYFGSTVVASLSGTTANSIFYTESKVVRTGAATQVAYGGVDYGVLALFNRMTATPTETLTGAVVLKMTGQSNVAGGDVTSAAMFVEWVP